MKNFLSNVVVIGLIIAVGYYFLKENGYNLESILNKTKTIELRADCSNIENLVLTSVTELTVLNSGDENHNSVTVRITAYDQNNDIIKQKNVRFERILKAKGRLSKLVTLPSRTMKCNCVILNSNQE